MNLIKDNNNVKTFRHFDAKRAEATDYTIDYNEYDVRKLIDVFPKTVELFNESEMDSIYYMGDIFLDGEFEELLCKYAHVFTVNKTNDADAPINFHEKFISLDGVNYFRVIRKTEFKLNRNV